MNIMGGGLFGIGFILVDMRVRKLFKRLLATPMNRGDFLWAIMTARLFFLIPEMTCLFLVIVYTFTIRRRVTWMDETDGRPLKGKAAAAVSLLLWFGVAWGGRWIGFS